VVAARKTITMQVRVSEEISRELAKRGNVSEAVRSVLDSWMEDRWPRPGKWYCDTCHQVIDGADAGFLEWLEGDDRARGFRIVHHAPSSPRYPDGDCYRYTNERHRMDNHLDSFVGSRGLVYLLGFLDRGPMHDPNYESSGVVNIREWVEIVRRLHTPLYEEARRYWRDAEAGGFFEGANEISPYVPNTLWRIISQYGPKSGGG
jgi:hypothetical protein